MDVYEKLRRAYKANKGVRLTSDDVTKLVLLDSAIETATLGDEETGITVQKTYKRKKNRK